MKDEGLRCARRARIYKKVGISRHLNLSSFVIHLSSEKYFHKRRKICAYENALQTYETE